MTTSATAVAAMAPAVTSRAPTAGLKVAVSRVPMAGAAEVKDVAKAAATVAVVVAVAVAGANAAVQARASGWTPKARCRRLMVRSAPNWRRRAPSQYAANGHHAAVSEASAVSVVNAAAGNGARNATGALRNPAGRTRLAHPKATAASSI